MRDLGQVLAHVHDTDIEIGEGSHKKHRAEIRARHGAYKKRGPLTEAASLVDRRPDWPGDQAIGWYPSRVPAFKGRSAYYAFVAADLTGWSHGLSAAVNRATLVAGSVSGF